MIKFIEEFKWLITIISLIGIEIAPIKISPLSWLGKIVGKLLGIDDIDKIFMCENRCSLGVCASGCGLYLNKIEFE